MNKLHRASNMSSDPHPTPKPEDVVREALADGLSFKTHSPLGCQKAITALDTLIQQRDVAVKALETISKACIADPVTAMRSVAFKALSTITGKEG